MVSLSDLMYFGTGLFCVLGSPACFIRGTEINKEIDLWSTGVFVFDPGLGGFAHAQVGSRLRGSVISFESVWFWPQFDLVFLCFVLCSLCFVLKLKKNLFIYLAIWCEAASSESFCLFNIYFLFEAERKYI
jgi:hypothetical protein